MLIAYDCFWLIIQILTLIFAFVTKSASNLSNKSSYSFDFAILNYDYSLSAAIYIE